MAIGNIVVALIIVILFNFGIGFIVPSLIKSVIFLGVDFTNFLRSATFTIINLIWLKLLTSESN